MPIDTSKFINDLKEDFGKDIEYRDFIVGNENYGGGKGFCLHHREYNVVKIRVVIRGTSITVSLYKYPNNEVQNWDDLKRRVEGEKYNATYPGTIVLGKRELGNDYEAAKEWIKSQVARGKEIIDQILNE